MNVYKLRVVGSDPAILEIFLTHFNGINQRGEIFYHKDTAIERRENWKHLYPELEIVEYELVEVKP